MKQNGNNQCVQWDNCLTAYGNLWPHHFLSSSFSFFFLYFIYPDALRFFLQPCLIQFHNSFRPAVKVHSTWFALCVWFSVVLHRCVSAIVRVCLCVYKTGIWECVQPPPPSSTIENGKERKNVTRSTRVRVRVCKCMFVLVFVSLELVTPGNRHSFQVYARVCLIETYVVV